MFETIAQIPPAPAGEFVGFLLILGVFLFWMAQISDAMLRRFPQPGVKAAWLLAVILLPLVGAVVYQGVGKKRGTLPDDGVP